MASLRIQHGAAQLGHAGGIELRGGRRIEGAGGLQPPTGFDESPVIEHAAHAQDAVSVMGQVVPVPAGRQFVQFFPVVAQ
ncbi:hypothetical protein AD428_15710 [Achromobacter sp. DMS1]|nr:hypothetical protein AD428_15710 [Achromobacter sp. DMS1]